jgi:hypothetical protein
MILNKFYRNNDYDYSLMKEVYNSLHEDFTSVCIERNNLIEEIEQIKAQQLKQNWDGIPIGLSDEQCDQFEIDADVVHIGATLKQWLKTQTFSQCRVFTDSEIQQKYQELYDDYQSLLVDNQQFQPNWDNDAQQEADFLVLTSTWLNKSRQRVGKITSQKFDRPKPPAHPVEVGQVWNHIESGNEYIVDEIIVFEGKTKIGEWAEDLTLVAYNASNVKSGYKSKYIYRRPIEDFLAKFEQVQS